MLEPLALMRRLAVLVPAPYQNLVRYHGVFANRSKYRSQLPKPEPTFNADTPVNAPPASRPSNATNERKERVPWAALLRRLLDVDALACPRCSTPMLVLAFLTDPSVVKKILVHLDLPAALPAFGPARCPFDDDPPATILAWTATARSPP